MAQYTEKQTLDSLIIYYPSFSRIDLICGQMPSKKDKEVILCCEAAYTEKKERVFSHENIDGDHVSGGKRYSGTPCQETETKIGNTGIFAYYDNMWHYAKGTESADLLDSAETHHGMAFGQAIIYWEGEQQKTTRGTLDYALKKTTHYRVLAELNGRLCIIDSKDAIPYARFLELLEEIKPTYAIYLDMGHGWNYSWWRDDKGVAHEIHPTPGEFTTNWVTFYK